MCANFYRKLGNQSKPLVTVSAVDDKTISFKQESLVKTSEFSCQIGVPFDETTADGRKVSDLYLTYYQYMIPYVILIV